MTVAEVRTTVQDLENREWRKTFGDGRSFLVVHFHSHLTVLFFVHQNVLTQERVL